MVRWQLGMGVHVCKLVVAASGMMAVRGGEGRGGGGGRVRMMGEGLREGVGVVAVERGLASERGDGKHVRGATSGGNSNPPAVTRYSHILKHLQAGRRRVEKVGSRGKGTGALGIQNCMAQSLSLKHRGLLLHLLLVCTSAARASTPHRFGMSLQSNAHLSNQ